MKRKEKLILLETIETLRKINPWKIDIRRELEKIYELLKEYFSLIIAGLAADNAAFIYNKKIDEIGRILESREQKFYKKEVNFSDIIVPNVDIKYLPQKYLINITDLVDQLNDILEREISKKMESDLVEVNIEDIRKKLEERLDEARQFILYYMETLRTSILFTDLAKIGVNRGIHPLYILYAILFMVQEDIIEIDFMETDGYVEEIIIKHRY